MIFKIYNSNGYLGVNSMRKVNIGLFGLLIIILLILYQNYMIMSLSFELESSINNLNLLVEDIHNDVHELIK